MSGLSPLRAVPALLTMTALLAPSEASAYCQTRTCREDCELDSLFCVSSGQALHWTSSCVTFSVERSGSVKNGIDAETVEAVTQAAFDTWQKARCGDGTHPSIEVTSLGEVECSRVEYNQDRGNANIIVFRDDEWLPNTSGDALALTTVWYDPTDGRIYDVDMEVNATSVPITVGKPEDGADLASIITHEAGHFLGLSHSRTQSSVMFPFYNPGGQGLRVLAPDDEDGICAAYPPDRAAESSVCSPRHGFSSSCSEDSGCCSLSPGRPDARAPWALSAFSLAVASLGVRRKRARSRR